MVSSFPVLSRDWADFILSPSPEPNKYSSAGADKIVSFTHLDKLFKYGVMLAFLAPERAEKALQKSLPESVSGCNKVSL